MSRVCCRFRGESLWGDGRIVSSVRTRGQRMGDVRIWRCHMSLTPCPYKMAIRREMGLVSRGVAYLLIATSPTPSPHGRTNTATARMDPACVESSVRTRGQRMGDVGIWRCHMSLTPSPYKVECVCSKIVVRHDFGGRHKSAVNLPCLLVNCTLSCSFMNHAPCLTIITLLLIFGSLGPICQRGPAL